MPGAPDVSALALAPGLALAGAEGTHADIVISVSDGTTEISLNAFTSHVVEPTLGTATLSWQPPNTRTEGGRLYWSHNECPLGPMDRPQHKKRAGAARRRPLPKGQAVNGARLLGYTRTAAPAHGPAERKQTTTQHRESSGFRNFGGLLATHEA